jgi:hypothetical protein
MLVKQISKATLSYYFFGLLYMESIFQNKGIINKLLMVEGTSSNLFLALPGKLLNII